MKIKWATYDGFDGFIKESSLILVYDDFETFQRSSKMSMEYYVDNYDVDDQIKELVKSGDTDNLIMAFQMINESYESVV